MSLLSIPLDKITEAELRDLIAMKVSESTYLDYKREPYGGNDKAHSEFLADISSFANTLGGDIVIGMSERAGIPVELLPLEVDADKEIMRLEQIARSGLEPRVSQLRFRAVPIATGGNVLVIRIGRSFLPPHRVIHQGKNKFFARGSMNKYEPNVQQLRHLFNDAPHVAEHIHSFHADRLVKITAGDTPIPLNQFGKVVVHVIPAPSFAEGRLADIIQVMASGTHVPLPFGQINTTNQAGCNLDGFFNYTSRHEGSRQAYAQFFRNGAIESVAELPYDGDGKSHFTGRSLTSLLIDAVNQYLGVLKSYDTGLPIYVFLSLCNAVKTVYSHSSEGLGLHDAKAIGRDILALPNVYLEGYDVDVPAVLRPIFNVLWNAVGLPQCDMYDNHGQWRRNDARS
ncbi:AAA-4 family protein [Burkholderia pseudomallei]|uniref:AlbA family DNA-binding domain-containing protein n=1 Tax=Burkholderia pseudomallei TaxID=28450 RepID=UPI0009784092|nr:ATP-binding protein [Burkholderia pseudomallei]MBF4045886.1 ATP-binding protein [Burkholderia pseudomallei]CAJ3172013.1 AAA-4 family protein [Burkholderia pseudomallei]CAJ3538777.1 AAA-4 family protein [Burkholderia pseudomallei]CAJ4830681.1 AAA-4 family protein [Burkholderia pseudomallei]CAJ4980164.1 AAA-4 family protein [Burkholderia pseudomallei]